MVNFPPSETPFRENHNMDEPKCEYRCAAPFSGQFFCRHDRVRTSNSLVVIDVCDACTQRLTPSETPRDCPEFTADAPGLPQLAWNLVRSLATFVADGLAFVSPAEYEERLRICDLCDRRRGNVCSKCGCNLSLKARGRAFNCPLGKWQSPSNRER